MNMPRFATSKDGIRIAYDVQGQGATLILIHGFTIDRKSWHRIGWVERLKERFQVITLDMRGRGESDKPTEPAAYKIEALINDVLAVADDCRAEKFSIMAHSWGGSVGLHLAARSRRVARAVIAGTSFGPIFTQESIEEYQVFLEELAKLKAEGRLDELEEANRTFAAKADFPVLLASNEGLRGWPGVEPKELLCPTMIYAGSRADKIADALRQYRTELEAEAVQLKLFEGLDHADEVFAIDQVLAPVLEFLVSSKR